VISGVNVIAAVLPDADAKGMLKIASQLADDDYVAILLNRGEARVSAVAAVPKTLSDKLHAGELIKNVSGVLGGSGGGNAELAQGGGEHVELVDAAREAGLRFLETVLRKNRK
jgi:alanyl-tRNA synthetase